MNTAGVKQTPIMACIWGGCAGMHTGTAGKDNKGRRSLGQGKGTVSEPSYLPPCALSADVHAAQQRAVRGAGAGLACLGCTACRLAEAAPEAERLISSSRHHGGPVGRLGQMQDAGGVARHLCHLGHGRVLPQTQLVLAATDKGKKFQAQSIRCERAGN